MASDVETAAIEALAEERGVGPDSIQIVRVKQQDDVAVVAVTFHGPKSGLPVRGFVGVRDFDAVGWRGADGAWSSGVREVPPDAIWSSAGGWWSGGRQPDDEDEFASAGGQEASGVYGGWVNDRAARTLRATDSSGRIEEDRVDAGVAILIWDGDFNVHTAVAELLDVEGRVIRSGPMRPVHPHS